MKYSYEYINAIKDFIKAALPAKIAALNAYFTAHSTESPIPQAEALKSIDVVRPNDNSYPFAVVYDNEDVIEAVSTADDIETWDVSVEVVDTKADLKQLRFNLYSYKDAVLEIVRENPTFGSDFIQAYSVRALPPLTMKQTNGHIGAMIIRIKFEL